MLYDYKKHSSYVFIISVHSIKCTFLTALPPLASPCCGPQPSDRLTVSSPSVFGTGQELLVLMTGLVHYVQQCQKHT